MRNKMHQQALRLEEPARLGRDIGASFANPKEFVPLFSLAALDLTPNRLDVLLELGQLTFLLGGEIAGS
jgi:hypothetical protein